MRDSRSPDLELEDQGEKSLLARRLMCMCGYKVRCEVMRYGDGLGEFVFFDDNEASLTRGERVWYCPGCHRRLGLLDLRS